MNISNKSRFTINFVVSLTFHAFLIILFLGIIDLSYLKLNGGSGGEEGAVVDVQLVGKSGMIITKSSVTKTNNKMHEDKENYFIKKDQNKKDIGNINFINSGGSSSGRNKGVGGEDSKGVGYGDGKGIGDAKDDDEVIARIWKKVNDNKYYPIIAKRQKMEGVPIIEFSIAKNGSIKWAELKKSSGLKILDEAALKTIADSAPLPYYPKSINLAIKYLLSK